MSNQDSPARNTRSATRAARAIQSTPQVVPLQTTVQKGLEQAADSVDKVFDKAPQLGSDMANVSRMPSFLAKIAAIFAGVVVISASCYAIVKLITNKAPDVTKDFMASLLELTGGESFKEGDFGSKAKDLESMIERMICDQVNITEVKEICEQKKHNCFLGDQFDSFFEYAEELSASGALQCVVGEDANTEL